MSDTGAGPGAPQGDENAIADTDTADAEPDTSETPSGEDSADNGSTDDTIRKLRKENAAHRVKAKDTDALARKVHAALVVADGRLVDPDALEYQDEHLTDPEALKAAVAALIEAKPYLRAKQISGDAGQGPRGGNGATPSFSDLFRGA